VIVTQVLHHLVAPILYSSEVSLGKRVMNAIFTREEKALKYHSGASNYYYY
jgi:hypothetical protein